MGDAMPGMSRAEIGAYFRAQRATVYRWARFLCRRPEDARDLVQDVFVRMLRNPPARSDNVAAVLAWLRRTTQRLAIDRWRSPLSRPTEPLPDVAGVDDPAEPERAARLQAALAALSEQQRLVLLARVCDEQSFTRIAADLDISVSSARTHYLRALARIRERMPESDQRRVS